MKRLIATALLLSALGLAACTSTVTPARVEAATPSYDGNAQNSGFLGFFPDGSGHLTPHARDRYNALVAVYGRDFLVSLKPDAGLAQRADGTWQIDAEHLADFIAMDEKHRAAIAPQTP